MVSRIAAHGVPYGKILLNTLFRLKTRPKGVLLVLVYVDDLLGRCRR